jgi:virginiamycin B lyase
MPYRVAPSALLALLFGAAFVPAAVVRDYPIPTPMASPSGIILGEGGVWLTELEGNKIANLRVTGFRTTEVVFREFEVPTPNSGPIGLVAGPGGYWFTESRANKIGRVTVEGIFKEYAIPTPGSVPRAISAELWFTEFEGNKIGRVVPDAKAVVEYEIPTPGSGPAGIVRGPDGNQWFTEFRANKIGRITATGSIREFPIPTPNSGPLGITAFHGAIWFTESNASKIGRITPDGEIVEFSLPTPSAGPTDIKGEWFVEANVNRIGRINADGVVTEYSIPGAGGAPVGLAGDFRGLWFVDASRNRVGRFSPDRLVVVGAGWMPPWDTDFDLANREGEPLRTLISQFPQSLSPCLSCPEWIVEIPPRGTRKATGQQGFVGHCCGGPGIGTLYIVPLSSFDAPTVAAHLVDRTRPTRTAEVPVVRLSTIEALDPGGLVFPSATRSASAHSNLILAEVAWAADIDVRVEAFSAAGESLGSREFHVPRGRALFLADVLAQLAVIGLDSGQIRVTKTGGTGLMWGILATMHDDGRLSVSLGANP